MCVCMHGQNVCMCVFMCVCSYVCVHVYMYAYVCMCLCTFVCMYVCLHVCVYFMCFFKNYFGYLKRWNESPPWIMNSFRLRYFFFAFSTIRLLLLCSNYSFCIYCIYGSHLITCKAILVLLCVHKICTHKKTGVFHTCAELNRK